MAEVAPKLPSDVGPILEQYPANCFAWQQFIYLNWPADSRNPGLADKNKLLGAPGPVVWETYRNIDSIFLPGAKQPRPWGHEHDVHSVSNRRMSRRAKSAVEMPHLSANLQAAPTLNSWLVARNGTLTRYEVLVNKIEFEYILENEFYNPKAQKKAMKKGGSGINQPVGAMEIKAAWLELTDDFDSSRFLTTKAILPADPNVEPGTEEREALMGLVGMHIIHKTPTCPQYVWATFEHVDNCPDVDQEGTDRSYNFFVPHFAAENFNLTPEQNPNQVKRVSRIPREVQNLNGKMRALIQEYNQENETNSPLGNYILVNTQWPSDAAVVPPAAKVPLVEGNMIPRTLLNTTLETYVQYERISCMTCHRNATIAGGNTSFGSDYSFVYGAAKSDKK